MQSPERVLVVEDDDSLRQILRMQLSREGYQTTVAASSEGAAAILEKSPQNLVIADLNLPGSSGIELLKKIHLYFPETPVIIMTAFGTVQSAVEAMKAGAYDYIIKPIHPMELKGLVKRVLEHSRLAEEVEILRSTLDQKYGFEQIIGSSEALKKALDIAARVAATDATVLVEGETGTGKELVAKAIHLRSARRERAFMAINCGAIPRELLESELFGYVKGSFTGAHAHKKGKVEMVNGGTMLLDEIGEMPLELQVKILRLLQQKEIEKVGEMAPTKVDVRIIASTNRNLAAMVKEGTFREDLFYRLLVVPICVPPLRERVADIPELVEHFFGKFKAKHRRVDLTLPQVLLPYFLNYQWPGNVRQLENIVERIVLLSRGTEVTLDDLPDSLLSTAVLSRRGLFNLPEEGISLERVERELLVEALRKFHGNKTQAARFLDLSRRTFSYRLKKFGIETTADIPSTVKPTAVPKRAEIPLPAVPVRSA
jgi:DNA-binding NtrC family response regulator